MNAQEIKGHIHHSLLLLLCIIIITTINECVSIIVFAKGMYDKIPFKDFQTMIISYFIKNFSILEIWVVCLSFLLIIELVSNIKDK